MSLPQQILVATDFSDASERALDYAIDLAARLGAHVTVLHAYELPIVGFPDGAFVATADMASQLAEAAQSGLDAVVRSREERGVHLDKVLRQDPPWDAVTDVAKELGADLVVVGTHGRRGFVHALLGSVAEKIIRTASCPVLTVRGAQTETLA